MVELLVLGFCCFYGEGELVWVLVVVYALLFCWRGCHCGTRYERRGRE